jgi:hypothetical protein
MTDTAPTIQLWQHIFADRHDWLAVFSGLRKQPGDVDLSLLDTKYFRYPEQVDDALKCARRQDELGREAYFAAHLLFDRRRIKENASPILCLWSDNDGGQIPEGFPAPTARLQSSPGHFHDFWRLSRAVSPARAEQLTKRIALAIGADPSGFDLSQVLRIDGTRNHKYADKPTVQLVSIDTSTTYDPDDLDKILPPLPKQERKATANTDRQPTNKSDADLLEVMFNSQQGDKIRALWNDNREALAQYPELLEHGRVDPNKCDLSLTNFLAHYTASEERSDAMFRESERMRDKWDEKHRADGATYGEMTIEKAFDGRETFYTPRPPNTSDLTAEAIAEAERIVDAAARNCNAACPKHCPAAADLERKDELIVAQQRIIREQRQILENYQTIISSHLPPAQKLADLGILEVLWEDGAAIGQARPLYAQAVVERTSVSPDIISRRLDAIAELGVIKKQTKIDTARLIPDPRDPSGRRMLPPKVTRATPLVDKAAAWQIVAQAAESVEKKKRKAPERCPDHPTSPHSLVCTICGYIVGDQPQYSPNADIGFDELPALRSDVLPQASAIPQPSPAGVATDVFMPQASAIPDDLTRSLEDMLDVEWTEPDEPSWFREAWTADSVDPAAAEQARLAAYQKRYDHLPSPAPQIELLRLGLAMNFPKLPYGRQGKWIGQGGEAWQRAAASLNGSLGDALAAARKAAEAHDQQGALL